MQKLTPDNVEVTIPRPDGKVIVIEPIEPIECKYHWASTLEHVAKLMQECVKAGKMEWKNDHGDWYEWRGDDLPNIAMFENGTIRPHDPLREIKEAFARGETVEMFSTTQNKWTKINAPFWDMTPEHYRIAPKRWYRVAEVKEVEYQTATADNEFMEKQMELFPGFVRWLTERVYY